ncbi:hypothetical protein MMC29_004888 [Sticta canariensis]|nr:hypothetical protein [Sticta canariensis]
MAATAAKTVILITGANAGIGFELAAQLMAKGSYHVLVGSRALEKGQAAVKELETRKLPGSVELVPIDVTNDDTIEHAATTVQHDHARLDILVNNAGIGSLTPPLRHQMREAFDTNATGPAVVTQIFAPLLQKSSDPLRRIVNISSGAGSINRRLDPSSPIYKLQEVPPARIKVFAYDPGFTQSNLSAHNNAEHGAKLPSEAVMPLIDVLEGKRDDEAGKFLHNTVKLNTAATKVQQKILIYNECASQRLHTQTADVTDQINRRHGTNEAIINSLRNKGEFSQVLTNEDLTTVFANLQWLRNEYQETIAAYNRLADELNELNAQVDDLEEHTSRLEAEAEKHEQGTLGMKGTPLRVSLYRSEQSKDLKICQAAT